MASAFRAVTASEIPALRAMARAIWEEAYAPLLPPGQIDYMMRLMYAPEVIADEMARGILWEWLLLDERPCGYLSYGLVTPREVRLNKIYILREGRGKGLATEGVHRVAAFARAKGAAAVFLTVNKGNRRAIRAYEKCGFQIADAIVKDIGGGFVMDDWLMRLEVPEES